MNLKCRFLICSYSIDDAMMYAKGSSKASLSTNKSLSLGSAP